MCCSIDNYSETLTCYTSESSLTFSVVGTQVNSSYSLCDNIEPPGGLTIAT